MSLLSTLLATGFRQAASVMIEVGPAKTDLGPLARQISGVEVRTSRSDAATATITFDDRRGSDGRWMAADSPLLTAWAKVVISADFVSHVEEIFRGYIAELKPQVPQNAGDAKLVIELQDEGFALSREHMRRVWGTPAPIADQLILTELIAPLGLKVAAGSGQGQSARSLAQDGPPIVFLRDRARANGYDMIFARGEIYFGPMRLSAAPQATIMVQAGSSTNCLTFNLSDIAGQPDVIVYELAPRTEGAAPETARIKPAVLTLGRTPVAAEGATVGTPAEARVSREGDEPPDATRARAQGMADQASFRIKATGELDGTLYGHVLTPGLPVRVDGPGDRNGGVYYVDKVSHVFTPDGYRQGFEIIRNARGDDQTLSSAPVSGVLSAIASLF
jgi:hypothetical protein